MNNQAGKQAANGRKGCQQRWGSLSLTQGALQALSQLETALVRLGLANWSDGQPIRRPIRGVVGDEEGGLCSEKCGESSAPRLPPTAQQRVIPLLRRGLGTIRDRVKSCAREQSSYFLTISHCMAYQ